jgi:LysR family transcriptional regulator of abg operon
MELRQLRHFLKVLQTGSIGDAARQLGMSQPALSKSIQALERSVGAPLFTRSSQGMVPTAFAQSLENRARVISAEEERVHREVGELLGAKRGRIVIGTTPAFAEGILPLAAKRFLGTHPDVEIVVSDGFLDSLAPAIKAGKLDFAFLSMPHKLQDSDIREEVLLKRRRVFVIASGNHSLEAGRRIAPQDLCDQAWILPWHPDLLRRALTRSFENLNLPPPRPIVEFGSILFALRLMREGKFLSYFSELLIAKDLKEGYLKILNVPELIWVRDLGVIFRRDAPMMPAARDFLDCVRSVCAEYRQTGD